MWVLTSMEEVAYFFTPTREGDTIQDLLKDFSGVLVSDFYAAYDAIDCPQQKCLIHFIRDLNDAILKHPYDDGLKQLAGDFAGLVKPMVETVDRRGLKKRFLGKHRSSVDRFYKRLADCSVTSEAAEKLVDRLQKNRNKMFTFLDFDDVPWNNNNAEHAVKAFASLRRVIEGPTTEKGLRDFLVLLSICETCKCKNVDFLDFLRSGSKDIDDFASNGQKQRVPANKSENRSPSRGVATALRFCRGCCPVVDRSYSPFAFYSAELLQRNRSAPRARVAASAPGHSRRSGHVATSPLHFRSLRSGAVAHHNDNRPLGLINLTGNDTDDPGRGDDARQLCGNSGGATASRSCDRRSLNLSAGAIVVRSSLSPSCVRCAKHRHRSCVPASVDLMTHDACGHQ